MNFNSDGFVETDVRTFADHFCGLLLRPVASHENLDNIVSMEYFERFIRKAPPPIPLSDYLYRLISYLKLDLKVLKALLLYKMRLLQIAGIQLNELSAHRFVLAGIVISSKALLDDLYTATYYARVGGVSVRELSILEIALCRLLEWRVFCFKDQLEQISI